MDMKYEKPNIDLIRFTDESSLKMTNPSPSAPIPGGEELPIG